jgi:rubredoxin
MPQIASHDEVKSARKERQVATGTAWRTPFITPDAHDPASAQAFLVEGTPGRVIDPHFHDMDQYQVVVHGGGTLGKHDLALHAVHYSRGLTPYGPIVFGERGLGFLTLRAHRDELGAQYVREPENRRKLTAAPERKPWQVTELPRFGAATAGVALHEFTRIRDDHGLAGYSISLAPHARAAAPDPAASDGQYLIVTRGSLVGEGREREALTVVFVKPQEGRFALVAGARGLDVLALHFPRRRARAAALSPAAAAKAPGTRVWQCALCAFVYDEAKGMPEEGVAPGTPWERVPETWACPDCAAAKSDFRMSVVG